MGSHRLKLPLKLMPTAFSKYQLTIRVVSQLKISREWSGKPRSLPMRTRRSRAVLLPNGLESYLYNLKNTLEDDEKGVSDKIEASEKNELISLIDESLDWLEENPEAEADEYSDKQKEV